METQADALAPFHPVIRKWFSSRFGAPTDVQAQAWQRIARGEHVLITAPTGSGKTLAAFLWAIHTLLAGGGDAARSRVLYVSPLKALNNDIRRNLEEPLAELRTAFAEAGEPLADIRVAVRSGDSPPAARRRMLREPPEIFITTPESLNILLTSLSGRRSLTGFGTVILDEIHAVAPTKRGTYLMTAIERLTRLCGEFQRIALSATVSPPEIVAEFVGGLELVGAAEAPPSTPPGASGAQAYRPRAVGIVRSDIPKRYALRTTSAGAVTDSAEGLWRAMATDCLAIIQGNRSTLFFCNSRRMAEKITRLINEAAGRDLAYAHHGSLSREIREVVEKRFKAGELAAIVATSSLELGIDIGSVDEVVLVQTPSSVSGSVQRIGRSGHQVGGTARGTFYPLHARDLVDAAALALGVEENDIERTLPVEKPLDVLAQAILSMTAHEARPLDDLYAEICAAWPYRSLPRREFDLVVQMLAGRYADSRVRELRPRLAVDGIRGTARAREGVATLLHLSGGVIPDRGYFQLRLSGSKARLGELDEEFVWERRVGDVFPFGNQAWQIERVTPNEVEVVPAPTRLGIVPFWRAEQLTRSFHLSERIARFLEEADAGLGTPAFRRRLLERHRLDERAADRLIEFLGRQRAVTGASLPHRHHIVIEHFTDPMNTAGAIQTVIHTLWGGAVNRPLALALAAAWEEAYRYPLESYVNNDCILVNLADALHLEQLLDLVRPERLNELLRARLESTGFFGAHFRENAQRALLLPRRGFRERMPLWLNRLRSQKLLAAVSRFEDFPILLETWRDCLWREFDLETLTGLLEELRAGITCASEAHTTAGSPFAESIIWRQTNALLYADDTPRTTLRTSLTDELLAEVMRSPHLRPRLSDALIAQFESKVQRIAEGYAPGSSEELLEWIKERLFIPADEWRQLLGGIERDHALSADEILGPIRDRVIERSHAPLAGVAALEYRERIDRVIAAAAGSPEGSRIPAAAPAGPEDEWAEASPGPVLADFLAEWLRFYGPVGRGSLLEALGVPAPVLEEAVATLEEGESVLVDLFREAPDAGEEICDRENLEQLLRMRRAAERPSLEPLPIEALPLFLAAHQGVANRGDSPEPLRARIEQLFGYPARASLWEGEILPARLEPYHPQWLDSLITQSDLRWIGCGKETLAFCMEDDLDLFAAPPAGDRPGRPGESGDEPRAQDIEHLVERVLKSSPGRLSFGDLMEATPARSDDLAAALWSLAWHGKVTNDTFEAIRKGIAGRFRAAEAPSTGARTRRRGFDRWKSTRPFAGNWYAPRIPDSAELDALDREELIKERIRILLARYGVLFREVLANELPELRWASIFRTLRLMELSGEILTGRFFSGIPGVQFCSRAALQELTRPLPEDAVYWVNATDPASPCGLALPDLAPPLPPRVRTTHLVFLGRQPALISRRSGRQVEICLAPDHPRFGECLAVFGHLLRRPAQPLRRVIVESINDLDAARSPYAAAFRSAGFQAEYKSLVLWKSGA
jgi:ATP-dependent Lhr-like helicase